MTQGPLQNTIDDFWRMVWEHRVSAIVMLCQLEENGKVERERERNDLSLLCHRNNQLNIGQQKNSLNMVTCLSRLLTKQTLGSIK